MALMPSVPGVGTSMRARSDQSVATRGEEWEKRSMMQAGLDIVMTLRVRRGLAAVFNEGLAA